MERTKVILSDMKSDIASLILNGNKEFVDQIIESKEFKEDGSIYGEFSFNGIPVDGEFFETWLAICFDHIEQHFKEKYSVPEIDIMVDKAAEKKVQNALDALKEATWNIENYIEGNGYEDPSRT